MCSFVVRISVRPETNRKRLLRRHYVRVDAANMAGAILEGKAAAKRFSFRELGTVLYFTARRERLGVINPF